MTIVTRDAVLAHYERLRATGSSHPHALEQTASRYNLARSTVAEIVSAVEA